MYAIWKLMAVLFVTMPAAAYVAGTMVGPPATPAYHHPEGTSPTSASSDVSGSAWPGASSGPLDEASRVTTGSRNPADGGGKDHQRVESRERDGVRRAPSSEPLRRQPDSARATVPSGAPSVAPPGSSNATTRQPTPFPDATSETPAGTLTPETPTGTLTPETPTGTLTPETPTGTLTPETPTGTDTAPFEQNSGYGVPSSSPPVR
jgi:hypothetical protein